MIEAARVLVPPAMGWVWNQPHRVWRAAVHCPAPRLRHMSAARRVRRLPRHPVRACRKAHGMSNGAAERFEQSNRFYRGKIVRRCAPFLRRRRWFTAFGSGPCRPRRLYRCRRAVAQDTCRGTTARWSGRRCEETPQYDVNGGAPEPRVRLPHGSRQTTPCPFCCLRR